MPLPKHDLPLYTHFLKGINKEVQFRPFTGKEQKILLLAKQSEDEREMLDAMKQVVDMCMQTKVKRLPIFDFEDIFLRIRSKSVSESTQMHYRHKDTGEKFVVDVDLRDVEVKDGGVDKVIYFSDTYGVEMRYPTIDSYKLNEDDYILDCIQSVFKDDEVESFQDYSKDEQMEWIESLDLPMLNKIDHFLKNLPVLMYEREVELESKEKVKITLKGLQDFFY